MAHHVCPWWHAYSFDNSFRRLLHNPKKMLAPYVKEGMTVMDIGCGMGFFSIAMARMVGDTGCVISVDLQQEMLDVLQRRAERAGVAQRIRLHRCEADSLGVDTACDFVLAFWMVHETPDPRSLLTQVHSCLAPGGRLLIAEPRFHVSSKAFEETVAMARDVGFTQHDIPRVRVSRTVVLSREGRAEFICTTPS